MKINGWDISELPYQITLLHKWSANALDVLKDIEWCNGEIERIACPYCCNTFEQGHHKDCEIDNLLRRAKD